MALLAGNLDIRKSEDRTTAIECLRSAGIVLDQSALGYALEHLTDDWFELNGFDLCSLRIGSKASEAISLVEWAHVIQALYEFRKMPNIMRQVQRLRVKSHEKRDTALVILVARRYHRRGFTITFEPFGQCSTDLLITNGPNRLYVEVKRENLQEHRRMNRIRELGPRISAKTTERLQDWLSERGLRIEVKLLGLFSGSSPKSVTSVRQATGAAHSSDRWRR
jgi:hypothetical protein